MNARKAVLIVNPGSGRGKGRERALDFRESWIQKFGADIKIRETKSKEDIGVSVKETFSPDTVQIFLGGDGTVSECLQALSEMEKFEKISNPVGILPAGSGNSFLRDFDITDYISAKENLISALEKNESRDVDMALLNFRNSSGQESTRIMFNIFGVGVVPLIAELAMKMRFLGSFNYTAATLWKIFSHRKMKVDAVIDGKEEILESDFISICNSRYTGGAMI
ncbi:MAG TPA: diacylglycerol kinase family protein, partial [Leptospiraceae bacterium]|nr:diacylglycerol kinase family protein [Leptospiraceae bacterium]